MGGGRDILLLFYCLFSKVLFCMYRPLFPGCEIDVAPLLYLVLPLYNVVSV